MGMLATVLVGQAVLYSVQVSACWFTRMPASERPVCCDFSAKDRFTPPGGDCCKSFTWEASDPASDTLADHDVAPARLVIAFAAPAVWTPEERTVTTAYAARGSPPIRRVTETIVLRL